MGGAGGGAGGVVGLLLASTYLGGTGGCQHHHSGHLQHLIRAGQLPRPPAGRGLAVPGQGPGWLLQLTQVGALCIPWPVLLRHACHYHWGGSGGAAQSILVSNLHLGVRDLPRSRSWRRGRAGHYRGSSTHLRSLRLASLASLASRVMTKTALAFTPAHQTHSAVTSAEQRTISDRKACLSAWFRSTGAGPAQHNRAHQHK